MSLFDSLVYQYFFFLLLFEHWTMARSKWPRLVAVITCWIMCLGEAKSTRERYYGNLVLLRTARYFLKCYLVNMPWFVTESVRYILYFLETANNIMVGLSAGSALIRGVEDKRSPSCIFALTDKLSFLLSASQTLLNMEIMMKCLLCLADIKNVTITSLFSNLFYYQNTI